MKIHNIFYVILLQKILTNLLTNQVDDLPTLRIINNVEKQKMEDVFDIRSYLFKLQYWVKQIGLNKNRKQYHIAKFEN